MEDTVFGGLFWLAMATAQSVGGIAQPASYDVARADALMRRAWRGRAEASLPICSDNRRVDRIRGVDVLFGRTQQAYQRRFGQAWQGLGAVSEGRLAAGYQSGVAGVTSTERDVDPRCQSPNSFAGAIGEYQNGTTLALAELGG